MLTVFVYSVIFIAEQHWRVFKGHRSLIIISCFHTAALAFSPHYLTECRWECKFKCRWIKHKTHKTPFLVSSLVKTPYDEKLCPHESRAGNSPTNLQLFTVGVLCPFSVTLCSVHLNQIVPHWVLPVRKNNFAQSAFIFCCSSVKRTLMCLTLPLLIRLLPCG